MEGKNHGVQHIGGQQRVTPESRADAGERREQESEQAK